MAGLFFNTYICMYVCFPSNETDSLLGKSLASLHHWHERQSGSTHCLSVYVFGNFSTCSFGHIENHSKIEKKNFRRRILFCLSVEAVAFAQADGACRAAVKVDGNKSLCKHPKVISSEKSIRDLENANPSTHADTSEFVQVFVFELLKKKENKNHR